MSIFASASEGLRAGVLIALHVSYARGSVSQPEADRLSVVAPASGPDGKGDLAKNGGR